METGPAMAGGVRWRDGGGLEPEDHLLCELLLTKLNAIADEQKECRIGGRKGRARKGKRNEYPQRVNEWVLAKLAVLPRCWLSRLLLSLSFALSLSLSRAALSLFWANISIGLATALGSLHRAAVAAVGGGEGGHPPRPAAAAAPLFSCCCCWWQTSQGLQKKKKKKKLLIECKHVTRLCLRLQAFPSSSCPPSLNPCGFLLAATPTAKWALLALSLPLFVACTCLTFEPSHRCCCCCCC